MRAIALVFAALMFFVIAGCGDKGVQQDEYVRVIGTVYGRVTQQGTAFAINNVQITIEPCPSGWPIKWFATTDINGEYRRYFALNVPKKSLNLIVSIYINHTGYEYFLTKVPFANDSEFRVDIELEPTY
jgi:hypothetical protein